MTEIVGTCNTAVVYAETVDDLAKEQLRALCSRPEFAESKIRIMPDVHAGRGCTVGTTMTVTDRVLPAMVGVDIGCGMEVIALAERTLSLRDLDRLIHAAVPAGREIADTPSPLVEELPLTSLFCLPAVNLDRAARSIGSLGGGNHFIEVDRGEDGRLYLVIHTGSRHLGCEVAEYYIREAAYAERGASHRELSEMIASYRAAGREREIEGEVRRMKALREAPLPAEDVCLHGELMEAYLHDMRIVQEFASLNRRAIAKTVMEGMGLHAEDRFVTVHNYIDLKSRILRKGAVSAERGERLLIPINMRDGALICVGRGNPDWNRSAPHGAGRLLSRRAAAKRLSIEEYRREMEGIYSTCIGEETLDESPMAYKSIEEIRGLISETVEIQEQIRPIYNFKATDT